MKKLLLALSTISIIALIGCGGRSDDTTPTATYTTVPTEDDTTPMSTPTPTPEPTPTHTTVSTKVILKKTG